MSEVPVLVPIFPYAAEGGARPSSYFRQGNWKSETNYLKIFDEKIAPQAKFMKQIERQARFFWLNLDVYKILLTESWTICISLRQQWNKVRSLRNHWETRWNKVRALRNHSEEGVAASSSLSERRDKVRAFEESLRRRCGLQAVHWASVDNDHLHCMSCGLSVTKLMRLLTKHTQLKN